VVLVDPKSGVGVRVDALVPDHDDLGTCSFSSKKRWEMSIATFSYCCGVTLVALPPLLAQLEGGIDSVRGNMVGFQALYSVTIVVHSHCTMLIPDDAFTHLVIAAGCTLAKCLLAGSIVASSFSWEASLSVGVILVGLFLLVGGIVAHMRPLTWQELVHITTSVYVPLTEVVALAAVDSGSSFSADGLLFFCVYVCLLLSSGWIAISLHAYSD
jgi:hypothetical protein